MTKPSCSAIVCLHIPADKSLDPLFPHNFPEKNWSFLSTHCEYDFFVARRDLHWPRGSTFFSSSSSMTCRVLFSPLSASIPTACTSHSIYKSPSAPLAHWLNRKNFFHTYESDVMSYTRVEEASLYPLVKTSSRMSSDILASLLMTL